MKNPHFIKQIKKVSQIEKDDEEVLMTQIRVRAHLLDKELQVFGSRKTVLSEQKLNDLVRRLEIYRKHFDLQKPDFKWAGEVEKIYRSALYQPESYRYSWLPNVQLRIDEEEFYKLMTTRRSIRKFTHRIIDDRLLEKVLTFATWAPTNCNQQSLRFVVVRTKEIREKIVHGGMNGRMSPCIVAVVSDLRFYSAGDIECPAHDSGAAIQNMLLAIHYYGLGACYTSSASCNSQKIRTLLGVKTYEKITALIWVGYHEHSPMPTVRRNVAEIIRHL